MEFVLWWAFTIRQPMSRAHMRTSRENGQMPLPFRDFFRFRPQCQNDSGPAIIQVTTERRLEIIRTLFLEYARSLDFNLRFQNFDREMRNLPGDYDPPAGALLLALDGSQAAGCVAMRQLEPGICEMKRLYVRPRYRGEGLGRRLAGAVIDRAVACGYRKMRLDTVPSMTQAIDLYTSLGFEPIGAYRPNPVPGALFLERPLDRRGAV
jgi:ribosomal protein S18 acetylase RimI-like enzyme